MLSRTDRTVKPVGTVTEGPVYEIPDAGDYDPAIGQHVVDNSVIIEIVVDGTVMFHGSGFFLAGTDGRLIATANHVVPTREGVIEHFQNKRNLNNWNKIDQLIDKVKYAEEFVYRVTTSGGDQAGQSFVADVGARDEASDLAVLKLESQTDYTGLTFAPEGSVKPQDDLWITGLTVGEFPGQTVDAEVIAVAPEVLPAGTKVGEAGVAPEDIIIVEAPNSVGISGGVAWNAKGEAVGVMSMGRDSFAILIRSEKLKELKERYQQEIRENSMANEPTEEELSAWFMDVEELLELDSKGMEQYLDAVIRDAHLRSGDMEAEAILRDLEVAHLEMNPNMPILPGDSPLPGTQGTQIDDFAVGDAFARLVTGDPGSLGGLPGSIGGPIGGIEVEPELDFGPGFDVPLA